MNQKLWSPNYLNLNPLLFILIIIMFALSPHLSYALDPDFPENAPENGPAESMLYWEIPSVYAASKYDQKVTEAPASITIITADEIKKYGYSTLADILRSVRGFYISNDRVYDYLGVRGFSPPSDYNTRILLLVNGVRLNDSVYDTASIGTEFILDVDLIDRIEIVRGPGSSLYGSNALFGVINVVTKRGRDFQGVEFSGEAGSLETYKSRLSYGSRYSNGAELLLSGSYYESEGDDRLYYSEFDDPATNNGIAENSDNDRYRSLFASVSLNDFTLEGAYVRRDKRMPTGAYETVFNDSRALLTDEEAFIDLKYESIFKNGLTFASKIYYAYYYYYGDYPFDYADPGDPPYVVVNKDYSKAEWWGIDVHVSRNLGNSNKIILGGEFRDNVRQDQGNYDEAVYLDDRRSSTFWALFIQDELKMSDSVLLNAGLRYDNYSDFHDMISPRVALIYSPTEATALKALYGRSYRTPNAYELYYNDGNETQKASMDLDPEEIETYELVLEQQIGENLRGTISIFHYEMTDLITYTTDPADNLLVFRNLDNVKSDGIEAEIEGKFPDVLEGRVSYSYQETRNRSTDEFLPNSPRHMVKANVIVPFFRDHLFVGLEELYMSKRATVSGGHAGEHYITNMTLFSKDILRNLELSFHISNLFDSRYEDPGSEEHLQDTIEQNGRTFRAKLTYLF